MRTFKEFREVEEYVQFAPAAVAGIATVAKGLSKINPSSIGNFIPYLPDRRMVGLPFSAIDC